MGTEGNEVVTCLGGLKAPDSRISVVSSLFSLR